MARRNLKLLHCTNKNSFTDWSHHQAYDLKHDLSALPSTVPNNMESATLWISSKKLHRKGFY